MTEVLHPPSEGLLRHRLWFRFWRGWRKAMLGLVVLVAVAWGTRPGPEALWAAHPSGRLLMRTTLNGAPFLQRDVAVKLTGPASGFSWGMSVVDSGAAARSEATRVEDYWVCMVLWDGGRCFSIGAFGYVWVLG